MFLFVLWRSQSLLATLLCLLFMHIELWRATIGVYHFSLLNRDGVFDDRDTTTQCGCGVMGVAETGSYNILKCIYW